MGGVIVYLLLLAVIMMIHCLYFGEPISTLWFGERYDELARQDQLGGALKHMSAWERGLGELGVGRFERDVLIGGLLGLGCVSVSRVMSARLAWARRIDHDFALFFRGHSSLQLTSLAIGSSLVEEVVFRGWLQSLIGLIPASVVFGLLHIPPQRSHWPWTLTALIMGGVFGVMYEWRASITAPLIAHFTINHFNLHALAKSRTA